MSNSYITVQKLVKERFDELSSNSNQAFKTTVFGNETDSNGNVQLVVMPAFNFLKAEYTIINADGVPVLFGDLNSIISIDGEDFLTRITEDMIPFHGNGFRHQFVVYNQAGERFTPVFNRDLRIKKVSKF